MTLLPAGEPPRGLLVTRTGPILPFSAQVEFKTLSLNFVKLLV